MLVDGARRRQLTLSEVNTTKQKSLSRFNIIRNMPRTLFLLSVLGLVTFIGLLFLSHYSNGSNVDEKHNALIISPKKNHLDVRNKNAEEIIHVLLHMPSFNTAYQHGIERYQENFEWISFSSVPLHLHLVIPEESFQVIDQILAKANNSVQIPLKVTKYKLKIFNTHLKGIAEFEFAQDPQFSEVLANRMPCFTLPFYFPHLKHLIVIESSMVIQTDITDLVAHLKHFTQEQLIGIALQQVPTYRDSFMLYEKYNPGSSLGKPSKPGFNSALLLLDLEKMRHSIKFNAYLHDVTMRQLVHRYFFTKHNHNIITQDDILTLIGYEHNELFYILPCGWNRQLDSYYFSHSESRDYSQCDGKIYAEYIEEL